MMFDLEVDTDLIEQHIYERQALLCRYRYLLAQARELGLHTHSAEIPADGRMNPLPKRRSLRNAKASPTRRGGNAKH